MDNPVKAFRQQLGIARPEMARRAAIGYETLVAIELGYRLSLSPEMVLKLNQLGAPEDIGERYAQWRAEV